MRMMVMYEMFSQRAAVQDVRSRRFAGDPRFAQSCPAAPSQTWSSPSPMADGDDSGFTPADRRRASDRAALTCPVAGDVVQIKNDGVRPLVDGAPRHRDAVAGDVFGVSGLPGADAGAGAAPAPAPGGRRLPAVSAEHESRSWTWLSSFVDRLCRRRKDPPVAAASTPPAPLRPPPRAPRPPTPVEGDEGFLDDDDFEKKVLLKHAPWLDSFYDIGEANALFRSMEEKMRVGFGARQYQGGFGGFAGQRGAGLPGWAPCMTPGVMAPGCQTPMC